MACVCVGMTPCPVPWFAKEIRLTMKRLLRLVILAGLGCSPDGYRGNDAYPFYQNRVPALSDRPRWEESPYHWPLGPIDRNDPD